MKKTHIVEKLRGAWAALRAKPYNMATVEIGMLRCSECDYYKAAHAPAETTEATPPNRYYHEIQYLDNAVLVILYETTEDGPKELARAHGHIIHEGADGIAQAASYAMRLVWFKIHGEQ